MKNYLSIALLAIAVYGCKSEPARITINLEKGQVYTQSMLLKSSSEQTMNGAASKTTTLSESSSKFEVLDVKDTVYNIKVTYEKVATKMVRDGDTIDVTRGNPSAEILPKIIGKSYTMVMSNTGNILETKGINILFDDIFKNMPEAAKDISAMLRTSFETAYGDSAIRKNAEMSRALYPGKAVKEGDTWQFENSGGNNIMSPKIKGFYTLDKVTGSEYLISNKSTIAVGNNPTPIEMNNFSMKYSISGNMSSTNKIDKKTGMITELKAVQDIKGTITIKTPASKEETSMPIKAKNEITLTTTFVK